MSTFYPALNSIVDEEFLPEQLAFLNSSLSTLLGKIYYKDYEFSISNDKSQGFFDLKLVTGKNGETDPLVSLQTDPRISEQTDPLFFGAN